MPDRHLYLFIAILASLNAETRTDFDRLFSKRVLDYAFNEAIIGGHLPPWFCEHFSFDPLYGLLNGLRTLIAQAKRDRLITANGSTMRYRLEPLDSDTIQEFADLSLTSIEDLKKMAKEVQRLIDEKLQAGL